MFVKKIEHSLARLLDRLRQRKLWFFLAKFFGLLVIRFGPADGSFGNIEFLRYLLRGLFVLLVVNLTTTRSVLVSFESMLLPPLIEHPEQRLEILRRKVSPSELVLDNPFASILVTYPPAAKVSINRKCASSVRGATHKLRMVCAVVS
jgi:hypothetical protein